MSTHQTALGHRSCNFWLPLITLAAGATGLIATSTPVQAAGFSVQQAGTSSRTIATVKQNQTDEVPASPPLETVPSRPGSGTTLPDPTDPPTSSTDEPQPSPDLEPLNPSPTVPDEMSPDPDIPESKPDLSSPDQAKPKLLSATFGLQS